MASIESKTQYPDLKKDKAKCLDFFINFKKDGVLIYIEKLNEISNNSLNKLDIFLDDIREFKHDDEFINAIKSNTVRFVQMFESVADDLLPEQEITGDENVFHILQNQRQMSLVTNSEIRSDFSMNNSNNPSNTIVNGIPKALSRKFSVSIIPCKSEISRRLRDIKSTEVGHLILTKGMVSRVSDVKPHLAVCTYTCDVCSCEVFQEITGHQFMPVFKCTSSICSMNNTQGRLQMQYRGSRFVKYQEIRIQELPDQVPIGNIPRSISVHCSGDETRRCSPGDIVTVAGILMIQRQSGFKAIVAGLQTESYIEACHIEKEKLSYADMSNDRNFNDSTINEILNSDDPFELLAKSLAPEIFGHHDIKKALLLQLVGGVNRNMNDGVKIRGDINICLMGDPGLAKSQLLKHVAAVAPRGVYTTGKGSSGVGLTAAVVRDNFTGEMSLEGGALVLADKGICCIDEFDKMNEIDRTAIHEVMEQQTVSIAKAGISTTLNARTAVLAAANPLFGRYNFRKTMSENVNLPNSLLSRFDLLFIIVDKIDVSSDIALSKHVLHVHRYLKNPSNAHSCVLPASMKYYISEAKKIIPMVPKELTAYLVEAYVSLRHEETTGTKTSKGNDQTTMTPRQLLSILRLSQALSRLRMSKVVRHEDVDEALRLMHSSKSSLDIEKQIMHNEDPSSIIFNIIRDSATNLADKTIEFANLEAMILKRGFTSSQFHECLREYVNLGIIHLDSNERKVSLLN